MQTPNDLSADPRADLRSDPDPRAGHGAFDGSSFNEQRKLMVASQLRPSGVNDPRVIAAMAISAAIAALSGGLYAFFFHFLSPDMVGTPRSLELVAMLVVGGEGTLAGPVLGSVLLTMLPTVFQPLALYKTFASGTLLVLSFLYLPHGLFGLLAGWVSRIRAPAHGPDANPVAEHAS